MAQIALLIIIGILYLIFLVFKGISDAISSYQDNKILQNKRKKMFGNRIIDTTKSLFDRNLDIISKYAKTINTDCRPYYLDNLTRDCINEICLAENKISIQPGHSYLNIWEKTASSEWIVLSSQILTYFRKAKIQIKKEEQDEKDQQREKEKKQKQLMAKIQEVKGQLRALNKQKNLSNKFRKITKRAGKGDIFLTDINSILTPNTESWQKKEQKLINRKFTLKPFPSFTLSVAKHLNEEIDEYNKDIELQNQEHKANGIFFGKIKEGFNNGNKKEVLQRIDYIIDNISMPISFPKLWNCDYDPEQSILIVEIGLPDIVHEPVLKKVQLKTKEVRKPLTKKEKKEFLPKFHPATILRFAYEIFCNDKNGTIKLLVLNGWVEYDDPATGLKTKTYTSSLVCNRNQILGLNLSKLDPLAAFLNLKGKSAGVLIDIIPIMPTLSLSKKDNRFVKTKKVLNKLDNETNLASMDWQDFENLIAELFEKEFAEKGAEVKVTQSSRDRGVDAVVFDPDPIKGGKFVIQAKRYTKTVDVSAIRDLCAVVKKEGASRGILVTTSSYGPDAYAFAQNEPITLLNGSELLGLMEKHGYKFRINIAEARSLLRGA